MLRAVVADSSTEDFRVETIAGTIPRSSWGASVLDVGARNARLGALVPNGTEYLALDNSPSSAHATYGDLSEPLAFPSAAFESVVALDVLEHVDRFHFALRELLRVAARQCVISLPNCYELSSRLRMLVGSNPSGKYGLPLEPVLDRHRWLFTLDEAQAVVRSVADDAGWRVSDEFLIVSKRRDRLARWVPLARGVLSTTIVFRLCPVPKPREQRNHPRHGHPLH